MVDDQSGSRTEQSNLSSDELDQLQPDISQLMPEIGERFWILYYAADARNWDLAKYQLVCARKLFQTAKITTTKALATKLDRFIDDHIDAIAEAIETENWADFQAEFHRAVDVANAYHSEIGVSFIKWTLPSEPPQHLKLDAST